MQSSKAREFKTEGINYQAQRKYDAAIISLNKALELGANDLETYFYRGRSHEQLEHFDEAMSDYDKCMEIQQRSSICTGRGNVFRLKGCYDQALSSYSRAIELNDNLSWMRVAYYYRGITHEKMGNLVLAILDLSKAYAIDRSAMMIQDSYRSILSASANTTFEAINQLSNDSKIIKDILKFMNDELKYNIFRLAIENENTSIAIMMIDSVRGNAETGNNSENLLKKMKNDLDRKALIDEAKSNSLDVDSLAQIIEKSFSTDNDSSIFNLLYPFSNEREYSKVLDHINIFLKLKSMKPTVDDETQIIGVSLLFGESNFLSMLSTLQEISQVIILADVSPKHHKHIEHIIHCFNQSNTPDEYIKAYLSDNPILNEEVGHRYPDEESLIANMSYLEECIKQGQPSSIEEYYFLSSTEKFVECKLAAKGLTIIQIKLDLMDENKCNELSMLLLNNNAHFVYCNLTNIHNYDSNNKLSVSTQRLLGNSRDCFVQYSTGELDKLNAYVSVGLNEYFSTCLNKPDIISRWRLIASDYTT